MAKAVAAFRKSRNLPPGNTVDEPVWKALEVDTAPVLIVYTILPEDTAGPFTKIPTDLMKQAKLPALGYTSPLEGLAEKFHVSPKVLTRLNVGKNPAKTGEQFLVPNVLTMPPGQAARIEVSKSGTDVEAYDAGGKLIAWYAASAGSERDPLPIGEWKILGVARNPPFHYNAKLFWDAKNPTEKAKIAPGPNNPVGVVWIDLSKEHYGIHGTPEPSRVGHSQSHGCIRLTNWDAAELASMVKPNTPAILEE
jgi:lipoprotein-anchoring transpeptidase ErfK/SrfK